LEFIYTYYRMIHGTYNIKISDSKVNVILYFCYHTIRKISASFYVPYFSKYPILLI